MCHGPDGLILVRCGVLFAISLILSKEYSMPASLQNASVWRTVLVLPPIATSRMKASSIASLETKSRGQIFFATNSIISVPACRASSSRSGVRAKAVPLYGNANPRTSHGICCKQSRARATRWTCIVLEHIQFLC